MGAGNGGQRTGHQGQRDAQDLSLVPTLGQETIVGLDTKNTLHSGPATLRLRDPALDLTGSNIVC